MNMLASTIPDLLLALSLMLHVFTESTARQAPLQLAFGIMVFQRENELSTTTIALFNRLVSQIYEDELNHIYVIHADLKSDRLIHEYLDKEWCGLRENCLPIYPRDISWGGISVVEMNMALMQAADEFQYRNGSHSDWEYFVLLGHESIPLTTLQYAEKFLLTYPLGTNFINCWHYSGYDFFGQWEDVVHRLADVVVDNFANGQQHEGFEIQRPVPFGMDIYKTIQYVVISREFTRYALYGPETRRILVYLTNVKASDELILPTILHTSAEFAATATCDTTLHFTHWIRPGGSWSPEYLTMEHLPIILNSSTHLYARKIHANQSDLLLEAIAHLSKDVLLSFPYEDDDDEKDQSGVGVGVGVGGASSHFEGTNIDKATGKRKAISAGAGASSSASASASATVNRGKNEVRVQSLHPQKPLLNDKIRINSWQWMVSLGTRHLQNIYEDEGTPESVLEAVAQCALQEGIVDGHAGHIGHTGQPHMKSSNGVGVGVDAGLHGDGEGHSDTTTEKIAGAGAEPTPYQILMMLDAARRARETIEQEKFFRFLEEYWQHMRAREKQEEMHKQNQAKFDELSGSWKHH